MTQLQEIPRQRIRESKTFLLQFLVQFLHYLPTKTLLQLYYSIFYPHLTYGVLLWGTTSKQNVNQIVVLQKKSIRAIIKSNFNDHTATLFYQHSILKLDDIYNLHLGNFMYSSLNGSYGTDATQYYTNTS